MAALQSVFQHIKRAPFTISAINRAPIRPFVGRFSPQSVFRGSRFLSNFNENAVLSARSGDNSGEPKLSEQDSLNARRLCVRNLRHGATYINEDTLLKYFAQYGEVEEFKYWRAKRTKEPLGFAFITFENLEVAKRVLAESHILDSQKLSVELPKRKDVGEAKVTQKRDLTVLVSNVLKDTSNEEIKEHFSQFGKIQGVILAKRSEDDENGPSQYYIVFSSLAAARKCLEVPTQKVAGQSVDSSVIKFPEKQAFYGKTRMLEVISESGNITVEALREYFVKFGEVVAIDLVVNPSTYAAAQRHHSMAFVCFPDWKVVEEIARNKIHVVDGSEVKVLRARNVSSGKQIFGGDRGSKMAIEGLPQSIQHGAIQEFFEQTFGTIPNKLTLTRQNGPKRTKLCIIDFPNKNDLDLILKEPNQTIAGVPVYFRRLSWKQ